MAAFCNDFSRILQLLWNNQQFLFNRGMQEQLRGRESGSFICENDPRDIRVYASFLVNYLYNTNWVTYDDRFALQTALMELLTNALEHGNCNISFTEKTAYFFPARKWSTSSWKRTRIQKLLQSESIFPTLSPTKSHISRLRMRERALTGTTRCPARRMNPAPFQYHSRHHGNLWNGSFYRQAGCVPPKWAQYGLYFIVSGRYAVYAEKKLVSVLTPNDMFIGEMAFLLNDRRSATILAVRNGKLLRIPKSAFLNLIRKNPHYGIFLSKLLAQRLLRQTQKTIKLSSKLNELKSIIEIPDYISEV